MVGPYCKFSLKKQVPFVTIDWSITRKATIDGVAANGSEVQIAGLGGYRSECL
jgi:hypothetical protein